MCLHDRSHALDLASHRTPSSPVARPSAPSRGGSTDQPVARRRFTQHGASWPSSQPSSEQPSRHAAELVCRARLVGRAGDDHSSQRTAALVFMTSSSGGQCGDGSRTGTARSSSTTCIRSEPPERCRTESPLHPDV
eukprot:7089814-Prymnesium_polylepis.2